MLNDSLTVSRSITDGLTKASNRMGMIKESNGKRLSQMKYIWLTLSILKSNVFEHVCYISAPVMSPFKYFINFFHLDYVNRIICLE